MWIIPRQLTYYHFAPDTADLNSDWPEHWKEFLGSLLWRSKPTLWRTWRQRFKRASWLSRLCGLTLKPSRQRDFEDALILSLRATRANPSALQASEKGQTTPDTFGRILRESCRQLDLFGASLRTCPDTLPLDSEKFTASYEIWVTQLRQAYLARQSAELRTGGSDCFAWPTIQLADSKMAKFNKRGNPLLGMAVGVWPAPNVPNRGRELSRKHRPQSGGIDLQSAIWPTVTVQDAHNKTGPSQYERNSYPLNTAAGLLAPDSPSTNGKSQGLWTTPAAGLADQGGPGGQGRALTKDLKCNTSKLNPDWVEQLMNLPVGWTDLGSWATE